MPLLTGSVLKCQPTWSDLHGCRGDTGAALGVGYLQLEQVGSFHKVGQEERRLSPGPEEDHLQQSRGCDRSEPEPV